MSIGPELPPHLRHLLQPESSDSEPESIGPTLPPHLQKSETIGPALPCHLQKSETIGPALPCHLQKSDSIGPALPPHLQKSASMTTQQAGPSLPTTHQTSPAFTEDEPMADSDEDEEVLVLHESDQSEEDDDRYGPALPPGFRLEPVVKVMGPALPPGLQLPAGPALPPGLQLLRDAESSDDEMVGPLPLPEGCAVDPEYLQREMERRAAKMGRKLRGEEDAEPEGGRETWMLELPPDRAQEFGLGPRQFRARARQELGDRSVWTHVPGTERKPDTEAESASSSQRQQQLEQAARDRRMQKITDKHNKKKRKETLVEIHQKKLRKKQKKEAEARKGEKKERRPFDRDKDLQANRFDEAQKNAVLKKAQMLDDRFSRGNTKFL